MATVADQMVDTLGDPSRRGQWLSRSRTSCAGSLRLSPESALAKRLSRGFIERGAVVGTKPRQVKKPVV